VFTSGEVDLLEGRKSCSDVGVLPSEMLPTWNGPNNEEVQRLVYGEEDDVARVRESPPDAPASPPAVPSPPRPASPPPAAGVAHEVLFVDGDDVSHEALASSVKGKQKEYASAVAPPGMRYYVCDNHDTPMKQVGGCILVCAPSMPGAIHAMENWLARHKLKSVDECPYILKEIAPNHGAVYVVCNMQRFQLSQPHGAAGTMGQMGLASRYTAPYYISDLDNTTPFFSGAVVFESSAANAARALNDAVGGNPNLRPLVPFRARDFREVPVRDARAVVVHLSMTMMMGATAK
jgi:hypothetical protein